MRRKVNDVEYVTGAEAIMRLGIKRASLYTYVSRGLVRTVVQPGSRRKLYLKSDIERLKSRAGTRNGDMAVSQSLRYGEPLVQTLISEIRPEGPRYRGYAALELAAQGRSFELVADLLWTGTVKARDVPWPLPEIGADLTSWSRTARSLYSRPTLWPLLVMLAIRQSEHQRGEELGAQDPSTMGRALVCAFAGVAGVLAGGAYCAMRPGEFVAECLLRGFAQPNSGALLDALNLALILSAEHELSAPTFTARICASTGADLAASVASAILVQAGPMQAGGVVEVEEVLAAVMIDPEALPAGYTPRDLPCFNHPLYDRDPRATVLVQVAREISAGDPRMRPVFAFVEDIARQHGRYPNIFAALVLLCVAMKLPAGAAAFLHTLGRLSGWVAHAAEQRLSGLMLRPRARYMGAQIG